MLLHLIRNHGERLLNWTILIAAIACAGTWAQYWLAPRPEAQAGVPQYAAGDSLERVPEIVGLPAGPTLILFLNTGCSICTDSVGFYRRIVASDRATQSRVITVAASRELDDPFRQYLAAHQVTPDVVIRIADDSSFKLTRTPTIVLLDSARRVKRLWLGKLTAEREAEVLSALSQAASQGS